MPCKDDAPELQMPRSSPILEFKGKLTKSELQEFARWIIWQKGKSIFLRAAIFPSAGMLAIVALNNNPGLPLRMHEMLPLIAALSTIVLAWALISSCKVLSKIAGYDPDTRPDTTVRFYTDRLEMIEGSSESSKISTTLVRLLTTEFGVVCVSRHRRLPLFLLPSRVLTVSDTNLLLAFATSYTGQEQGHGGVSGHTRTWK